MSGRDHLLLAIDTAGADAGLVLAGSGRADVALLPCGPTGSARTEDLAAAAAKLLGLRGCDSRDVTLLGAVTGPGSYTGLRSGLAFVRGLAFADAAPAVGIGALELLAWRGAEQGERVIAAVEAGSGRVAMAVFRRCGDDVEELSPPRLVASGEWDEAIREADASAIIVPGAPRGSTAAPPFPPSANPTHLELRIPRGRALDALAVLIATRAAAGCTTAASALLPHYVGEANARPNRHRVAVPDAPE